MTVLLEHLADIDAQDQTNGKTPLHYAVHNRHTDGVRLLLDRGADEHIVDIFGMTPIEYMSPELVETLPQEDYADLIAEWFCTHD